MRIHCARTAVNCALAVSSLAGAANGQTPPVSPTGSVVVAKPTYTSIPMEIAVNRPAAEVWKRIGKYCDIGEWLQIPAGCTITSGKDGQFGAVRTVGAEVLVARTELSYTYTQTPKEGQPYNLYHGTLEARPVTDHVENRLHAVFRQLDAPGRRRSRSGQGEKDREVHAGAPEHENPRRRRQAATSLGRRSDNGGRPTAAVATATLEVFDR